MLPDSNIWYLQSVTPVGGNDIGVISRAPDIGAIACVGGLFSGYCFLKNNCILMFFLDKVYEPDENI